MLPPRRLTALLDQAVAHQVRMNSVIILVITVSSSDVKILAYFFLYRKHTDQIITAS